MAMIILFIILIAAGNAQDLHQVTISGATASSTYDIYPPNHAFDGKDSTFWHSLGSEVAEWLKLELETKSTDIIRKVDVINR